MQRLKRGQASLWVSSLRSLTPFSRSRDVLSDLGATNEGSPIAGSSPEKWAEMAAVTRRRWSSFKRRNGNKEDTLANRIEDLARGLCEKFENGGVRLAGPLREDYRGLAEQLADTLVSESR